MTKVDHIRALEAAILDLLERVQRLEREAEQRRFAGAVRELRVVNAS